MNLACRSAPLLSTTMTAVASVFPVVYEISVQDVRGKTHCAGGMGMEMRMGMGMGWECGVAVSCAVTTL